MRLGRSQGSILWLQVVGLAAVQGAIALTWVIYNIYLVSLLAQFGLPESWGRILLIVENALAVVMEPLMGGLSDQAQRWIGTRFPFIAVGVVLSAGLFVTIPVVGALGQSPERLRSIFLGVIIAWVLAMTVFRSPSLVLLGRYATTNSLPQAASVLTLVGGLTGAIRPLATGFLLSLPPVFTFAIGSLALLGATAALRSVNPQAAVPPSLAESSLVPRRVSLKVLGLLFLTGLAVAWGFRVMIGEVLPKVLPTELPGMGKDLLMGLVFIVMALAALVTGAFAVKLGNMRAMILGLGATAGLLELLLFVHHPVLVVGVTIALVAAFSIVSNGAIPLALSLVPAQRGGLGIGTYFGGFSAAFSVFGFLFSSPESLTLPIATFMGVAAFLSAGLFVAVSSRLEMSK